MQPTVVVSLVIEGGVFPGCWGLDRHSEGRVAETAALNRLLSLYDNLQLPIPFDIIGHFLLEDYPGEHDSPPALAGLIMTPERTRITIRCTVLRASSDRFRRLKRLT